MSVGNITSFDSLQTTHSIQGTLHKANIISGQADYLFDIGKPSPQAWSFGTGSGYINQVVIIIFTATKNTTTSLDLSGVLTNSVGDLLSTFSKVKYFKVEYLTDTQDSVNGNASTATVRIQPGASNPITTSPLGTAEQFTLNPGAVLLWQDPANGFTVTGGSADTFDFVHSNNVLDAKLRLTILGEK